jgi:hypothetical protein
MQSKLSNLNYIISNIESERLRFAELVEMNRKLREDLRKIKEARQKKLPIQNLHLDYFV